MASDVVLSSVLPSPSLPAELQSSSLHTFTHPTLLPLELLVASCSSRYAVVQKTIKEETRKLEKKKKGPFASCRALLLFSFFHLVKNNSQTRREKNCKISVRPPKNNSSCPEEEPKKTKKSKKRILLPNIKPIHIHPSRNFF